MWKVSPKTPHTHFLCCFQLYKLPLKTNRARKVFFPAKFFSCILEKENLAGKKLLFKRVNSTLQRSFFLLKSPFFIFKTEFFLCIYKGNSRKKTCGFENEKHLFQNNPNQIVFENMQNVELKHDRFNFNWSFSCAFPDGLVILVKA